MARLDRVVSVESFVVPPGWTFVRIETADGLVGWGEGASQTYAPAVAAAIGVLADRITGEDSDATEHLWELMWKGGFFRGGPILGAAVAAIDIALWDIRSRRRGEAIHALLGGPVRARVRAYAWCGWGDTNSDALRAEARERRTEGFDLVKLTIHSMQHLESGAWFAQLEEAVSVLHEEFGPGGFAVDCHGRLAPPMAKRLLATIAPYKPLFVEEPVLPEHDGALPSIAASTSIPIALGERLYCRADFARVVDSGATVMQPDIAMAGGFTETLRICSFVDTYGLTVAPHCAVGPITVAASLQLCLATSNASLQERDLSSWPEHVQRYVVDSTPLAVHEGAVAALEGDGLGIELDELAIRDAAADFRLSPRETLRHNDGAFAEW